VTDQATTDQAAATRRTRRQLLAGGTGALAAVLAAEALAGTAPAEAANGDNVVLGGNNVATATTNIQNGTSSSGQSAIHGIGTGQTNGVDGSTEHGFGVYGASITGMGVVGTTDDAGPALSGPVGVQGAALAHTGVYGQSGPTESKLATVGHGLHGITDKATSFGVVGENIAGGTAVIGIGGDFGVVGTSDSGTGVEGVSGGEAGVRGTHSMFGVGVHGDAPSGTGVLATGKTALSVQGPAVFSRSGILTVHAGQASATETGVMLTGASLVLATLQQDHDGLWIRSAVPDVATNSFTVHLSKVAPVRVRVAWFIVN
jgi:hypothetical protein